TFLPSQDALEVAGDKAKFASVMEAAGVPAPVTRSFEDRAMIRSATKELLSQYERVWIRARVGAGSRAALPVRTADQAVGWVDWWTEERGLPASAFLAAEYLPGREFAYESVWTAGRLVAGQ